MHTRISQIRRNGLLAALVLGAVALTTGCDRSANDTVGQKIDRTADKVASATDRAANRMSAATEDAAITAKVKSAVIAEPGLKALQIDVDTHDAVVTLSGTVDNDALKTRATQIAQNVDGVKSVVDNLMVKTG